MARILAGSNARDSWLNASLANEGRNREKRRLTRDWSGSARAGNLFRRLRGRAHFTSAFVNRPLVMPIAKFAILVIAPCSWRSMATLQSPNMRQPIVK